MAPRSKLCGCVSHEALGTFISSVKSMPNPLRTALKRAHKDRPDFKISTGHIFKNGVIRTMADGDADATVEAIAIKSDSIIAAGTLSECREASPGATEIDLEGKCMLPGLIETHVHLLPAAIYKGWVTLSPFDGQDLVGEPYKLQWVYDTLSSALANGEVKNGWLLGSAVDPSMFSDMDPSKEWMDPTAEGLDKNVSKDVCIFLMNSSGHLGYANTAALKEAGVDNPTGIVAEDEMETLIATAVRAISESNPNFVNEVLETLMGILQSAADLGVTTIFDALLGSSSSKAELDFFDELANSDECPQRLGGALWVDSEDKYKLWKETFGITPTTYKSDKFLVPFVKIISDGSNQGLTGYQHDPYPHPNPIINDGHESGLWYLEGVDHKKLMVDLVSDGWFLMVHANGDKAIEWVLEAFSATLEATGDAPLDKRHRIEHCSITTDKMLQDMKDLGVSPSFLMGHVGYWGKTMAENVFGLQKAELLDRAASADKLGIRFTLQTDYMVSPLGPLRAAEQAVTRDMEAISDRYEPLNAKECLDIRSALRSITYDAAWQSNMDQYIGQLKVGMKADLVVLEQDPVVMPSAKGLRHMKVWQTWMGGRRVNTSQ